MPRIGKQPVTIPDGVTVTIDKQHVTVQGPKGKLERDFHGRISFDQGDKQITVSGKKLTLNVGYSHAVDFDPPEGIEIKVEKNIITVSGIDKQMVGQVAAQIRSVRKPEPYKGKGIKYIDEVIRRKAGKVVKSASAG